MDEITIRPIRKLLIANRGEIAIRIMRTCESMGIATVAVYSDADAGAPFVRRADEAVRLGPAPSAESYLVVERLIEAARLTGADAIHPGFGFLAENEAFARACQQAGLCFVGPAPDAIRKMGSKREAKRIAIAAGVPVVPGYEGDAQDTPSLIEHAKKVGLPVLVKASAGGGGKGMRIAREPRELEAAIDGARREAEKSFADGTLLIEKYVERPRHVEIQIFGDEHGELVHLWERECSIQRRHQKIVEESPSPALDRELREKMGEAAVKLGRAIGYTNAGTVEMILAPSGEFYFLEVNTRLQVEHPVTEAITDLDLVELQLRIARGEPLPVDQEMIDTLVSGHAMEVRLYAEDPAQGFLPQSGRVVDWDMSVQDWLRVDTGVQTGSEVSIHYDPMLAKIIAWGPTRYDAIARLRWALAHSAVQGLRTNRDFLIRVLDDDAFLRGELSTHFIEERFRDTLAAPPPEAVVARAAIAAALMGQKERAGRNVLPSVRTGFRNNRFADQELVLSYGDDRELVVRYADLGGERFRVSTGGPSQSVVREVEGPRLRVEGEDGHAWSARVVRDGDRWLVTMAEHTLALRERPRFPEHDALAAADGCAAPMPGKIVRVLVSDGQSVEGGQTLLIMEAMKMEHSIQAPHAGVITELRAREGQQVAEGELLVVVHEPHEE